jgi:uncharacterized membrane protein required for colicin V production
MPDLIPRDWHWLDVALGSVLALVALNAGHRGFVREAGTLVGLAVGLIVAGRVTLPLVDLLAAQFGRPPLADEIVYVALVGLLGAVASLIAGSVRASLRLPGFRLADHLAGLALGVAEGAAGLGLVLFFATRLGTIAPGAHVLDGSMLAPIVVRWWLAVAAVLPPELGAPRTL